MISVGVQPRYSDAFPEGSPAEHFTKKYALKAKEWSKEIVEWVERCLSIQR